MLEGKLYNGAGTRNQEVVIERATDADANAVGEVLVDWTVYCSRFADAVPTSGREFMAAMQVQPVLQAIYKLPYDDKTKLITPRMRVRNNGRVLNIAAVFNENENNEKIVLWIAEPVMENP